MQTKSKVPTRKYEITLPAPYPAQTAFIDSPAKRKVVRAGRRAGKTVGMAIYAVQKFLDGRRILYAAPTADQLSRFWIEVTRALSPAIDAGVLYKNETDHIIELAGTERRIRAKTAYNADTLRGDYADLLILDEFQLMSEDTWNAVGAPMLLDNNGDAVFIYTPPSLHSRSASKANDPQHAAKLFKRAAADTSGRGQTFTFSSHENPYLSKVALDEITNDMTALAYRQEILAEDVDEVPGALWARVRIDESRVTDFPDLTRIVVGVDPTASADGDEAGVITAGTVWKNGKQEFYTLADDSRNGTPQEWASAAVAAYHRHKADCIVAEKNNGGDMVEAVIKQVDQKVNVKLVWASRGKATRAEPIAAIAEQGRDHHVGYFPRLEDELCMWIPGESSPNRLDAKVWAMTELVDDRRVKMIPSLVN